MTEPGARTGGDLSPAQRLLLERLVARRPSRPAFAGLTRVPPGTAVPLSSAQARLWFLCRMYDGSPEYNAFGALRLTGRRTRAEVEAALRALVARHDALRLRLVERGREPFQVECEELPLPLTWHDLRDLPPAAGRARAAAIGSASASTALPLDRAPLFRVEAIELAEGETHLVFVFHHVMVDGWAAGLAFEELSALLAGVPLPPAPEVRFIDYVAWQRAHADEPRLARQLDYWRAKLSGELPVLDVPKDRPRPAVPSRVGHTVPCAIPAPLARRIRTLAAEHGTTLFAALLAGYQVLLRRLSGQTDVIVGTPFAGRDHAALESVLGCFVNTVALRTDLSGEPSFAEVLRRVHATTIEAQDNQAVPFERVVGELKLARELNYSPVFQTLFTLQNTPTEFFDGAGAAISELALDSSSAKFDLNFSLSETADGLSGFMEYASDLFDEATVARYVALYLRLLERMVAEPECPVTRHPLVTAAEREHILHGLNPYERPNYPYRTMAEPFEEQVRRTPDAIALVGEEGTLSYAALNERANQLAHHLRAAGIGRSSFVAVCMERSFALVVALYAVAKAGAAYVPLDPELPAGRIAFMLEDTAPPVVLVGADTKALIAPGPWRVVAVDEDAAQWAALPAHDVACEGPTHHPVHLLYTSGSTGRPKAVIYPVDAAIAEIMWLQRAYPFGPGDANVFKTSYGFDVSIWEIFWTLYFGAKLVVCRPGGQRDPRYLAEMIDAHRASWIFLNPSLLQVFLDELPPGGCTSLRWVLSGGEPLTPRLRDTFYAKLGARLVNGYGPTEAGCVTDMVVPPDFGAPTVPLGRPAANYRLYVLDDELDVMPIGVPGEAYLAGEIGLGQCYHARPALTAERFIPDPYGEPGSRMYRTGDICRYRADGVLEHLGRAGTQVKLRGMRVEPAEVEAVLCEHAQVEACVVLAVDDATGKRLLAFVVPVGHQPFDTNALAEHAANLLPRYMLPAAIVPIEHVPTNVNGKLDRAALLARWRELDASEERAIVPPADDDERRLQAVFAAVLERATVGVTESFFDLGGHSLLVFKLIAACEDACGYRPSVADIFSAPSVRELRARMSSAERGSGSLVPLAPRPGKPLVAFVHAASGSALPFFEVAKHLGDEFSSYALQTPGIDDDHTAPGSIEELAASYVATLEPVLGQSPLILVGWSMGGCVALEMARQWRRAGTDVAALVMLDTWLPPPLLADAAARDELRRTILGIDILGHEGFALDQDPGLVARLERALDGNRRAFLDYAPAWFEGEVDYLRAAEPFPDPACRFPAVYAAAERGWSAHAASVGAREAAGNHFTLLAKEHAPALAAALRDIVDARLSFSVV